MKKKLISTLLFAMLPITMVIPSGLSATTSSKVSQTEVVMCQEVRSIEPSTLSTQVPQPTATRTLLQKELAETSSEPKKSESSKTSSAPKIESTPAPELVAPEVTTPVAVATASPEELDPLFEKYATEYGISSATLKIIANCESRFNPNALSKNGLYGGMFQFSASTWASTRKAMGLDENPELRFNAEEAIRTTAFKIANGGIGAWPHCGKKAQGS